MNEYFCRIENKKNNEIILEQGKDPYYAYVLLEGKANVYKDIDDKQVFVGTVKEGELFGILSFIGIQILKMAIKFISEIQITNIMK